MLSYRTLQVCSGVLGIAKTGAMALVAQLSQIGEYVETLWQNGKLRLMERGALCEAMVIISVAAGSDQQTLTVLDWVLGRVRTRWTDPNWVQVGRHAILQREVLRTLGV